MTENLNVHILDRGITHGCCQNRSKERINLKLLCQVVAQDQRQEVEETVSRCIEKHINSGLRGKSCKSQKYRQTLDNTAGTQKMKGRPHSSHDHFQRPVKDILFLFGLFAAVIDGSVSLQPQLTAHFRVYISHMFADHHHVFARSFHYRYYAVHVFNYAVIGDRFIRQSESQSCDAVS